MTGTELLIYSLVGFTKMGATSMSYAVDIVAKLMFEQGVPMADIQLSRDVFPKVAEIRGKDVVTISRRINRVSKYCWETWNRERLSEIIGGDPDKLPYPRPKRLLILFAYYTYYGKPFLDVIDDSIIP